jgi:hypothetical protein
VINISEEKLNAAQTLLSKLQQEQDSEDAENMALPMAFNKAKTP